MKKTLMILLIFLASACEVFGAENENIPANNSFSEYCRAEMAKVLDTYKGEQYSVVYKKADKKPERWVKISESVDPAYNIETKKAAVPGESDTEILIVKHLTVFYADNFESEQGARAETNVASRGQRVYKFFMSYENGQWALKKVIRYTHWHNKKWETLAPTGVFEILQSKNEIKQ